MHEQGSQRLVHKRRDSLGGIRLQHSCKITYEPCASHLLAERHVRVRGQKCRRGATWGASHASQTRNQHFAVSRSMRGRTCTGNCDDESVNRGVGERRRPMREVNGNRCTCALESAVRAARLCRPTESRMQRWQQCSHKMLPRCAVCARVERSVRGAHEKAHPPRVTRITHTRARRLREPPHELGVVRRRSHAREERFSRKRCPRSLARSQPAPSAVLGERSFVDAAQQPGESRRFVHGHGHRHERVQVAHVHAVCAH